MTGTIEVTIEVDASGRPVRRTRVVKMETVEPERTEKSTETVLVERLPLARQD